MLGKYTIYMHRYLYYIYIYIVIIISWQTATNASEVRLSGSTWLAMRRGGTVEPAGASPKNFNGLSLSLSLARLQCSQDQIEVIHLSTHSFTHTRTQLVTQSFIRSSCPSVSFRFVLANCRNYFVSPNTNLNQQLSHGAIHEALSFALLQLPFRFQFLEQLFKEGAPP